MKINPVIYVFLFVFVSCNDIKKQTDKDLENESLKSELSSYNYVYEGDLEQAYIKHRIIGLKEELDALDATNPNNENDENAIVFREEMEAEIFNLNIAFDSIKPIKVGLLPIIPPPPPPPPVPCLCFDVFNQLNHIVATNNVLLLSATLTNEDGKTIFSSKAIKPKPLVDTKLVVFDLKSNLEKFTDEGYITIEKTMKDETKKKYDVSVNVHPTKQNM